MIGTHVGVRIEPFQHGHRPADFQIEAVQRCLDHLVLAPQEDIVTLKRYCRDGSALGDDMMLQTKGKVDVAANVPALAEDLTAEAELMERAPSRVAIIIITVQAENV